MYTDIHVKHPLCLSNVNETWIFSVEFPEKKIINFMKIHPVEAELFMLTDGRTDMTKLIVAFRKFANAPKKYFKCLLHRSL